MVISTAYLLQDWKNCTLIMGLRTHIYIYHFFSISTTIHDCSISIINRDLILTQHCNGACGYVHMITIYMAIYSMHATISLDSSEVPSVFSKRFTIYLHSSPVSARYGVNFVSLIKILFQCLQCCMHYRLILNNVIRDLAVSHQDC